MCLRPPPHRTFPAPTAHPVLSSQQGAGVVRRLLPGWLVRYAPILSRLCVTLGMLTIIRLGYFIPVPGVDMARLPAAVGGMEGEAAAG